MNRLVIIMLSAVLLPACASQIPEQTRGAPSRDSPPAAAAQRVNGENVRWGGTIAAVENRQSQTWVEVAPCHLNNDGSPGQRNRGQGPFLARLEGNLSPAIYYKGRQLTVIGKLENRKSRAIDEYAYAHPVVNVETHHMWASLPKDRDTRGASRGAYSKMPVPYGPLLFDFFF